MAIHRSNLNRLLVARWPQIQNFIHNTQKEVNNRQLLLKLRYPYER